MHRLTAYATEEGTREAQPMLQKKAQADSLCYTKYK